MQTALISGAVPEWAKGVGSGDGSGYGDGYGYGSGYGSGYGDGDGYGYGSGSGDGDGYGYGSGYGSGSGYGDGYGYGSKEYWLSTVPSFSAKWADEQRIRLDALTASGATIAFWRSDARGMACNGGSNEPVGIGTVERISGPLKICTAKALHATLVPPKWKGDRIWIVALTGEIQWQDDKCGALEREIIGECL